VTWCSGIRSRRECEAPWGCSAFCRLRRAAVQRDVHRAIILPLREDSANGFAAAVGYAITARG
jgi:hypothetical protein